MHDIPVVGGLLLHGGPGRAHGGPLLHGGPGQALPPLPTTRQLAEAAAPASRATAHPPLMARTALHSTALHISGQYGSHSLAGIFSGLLVEIETLCT
jgi:hypothetical protein